MIHYIYKVQWSVEDEDYVATCEEFPSLSWLACTPEQALSGLIFVVTTAEQDLRKANDRRLKWY